MAESIITIPTPALPSDIDVDDWSDRDPKKVSQPTISYNGVKFGGKIPVGAEARDQLEYTAPPTYQLQGDLVYDDSGRTPIYTKYILTVDTIAYTDTTDVPGANLGIAMTDLTEKLHEPRRELVIKNIGLPIDDTIDPTTQDILWGVKPLGCKIIPIAGQAAAFVTWAVEFNMVTADYKNNRDYKSNVFYALNYQSSYDIDEHGLTTRTVSGYYQIAGKTSGNFERSISDQFRDKLVIDIPLGFRRVAQNWSDNLSHDKMFFTVVDRQFDWNLFPTFCTNASGEFTATAELPGAATGTAMLTVSYELAPGIDKSVAVYHFLVAAFAKQKMLQDKIWLKNKGQVACVIPKMMSVTIGQFNRKVTYSIGWTISGCLTDLMLSREIFDPIPYTKPGNRNTGDRRGLITEGSWKHWQGTVPGQLEGKNNRGVAGLRSTRGLLVSRGNAYTEYGIDINYSDPAFAQQPGGMMDKCPDIPEEYSYITYDIEYEVKAHTESIMRKFFAGLKDFTKLPKRFLTVDTLIPQGTNEADGKNKEATPGDTTHFLVMRFKSLRIQYTPTIPQPKDLGGKLDFTSMSEVWHDVKTSVVGTAGCHPVFLTTATYVWVSPYPIENIVTGDTGFCRTVKELTDANGIVN